MRKISTTVLSKSLGLSTKELFSHLRRQDLIENMGDAWVLTRKGEEAGGVYKESRLYGKYITWPDNFQVVSGDVAPSNGQIRMITATGIGRSFKLSANKVNFILSEIGWVKKGLKGWVLTEQGLKQGGLQAEDKKSGIPFVRWPETIVESKSLKETIGQVKGTEVEPTVTNQENQPGEIGFREKYEAKHRAADGHFVRSKAEMLIDNWLYMAEIVHAYERKLPIEEDVYTDFYIPTGKVYIEYWGYENDSKYLARKQQKIDLYEKYGFNLIQLQDKDVQNLDDILPKHLLKYGVQAY